MDLETPAKVYTCKISSGLLLQWQNMAFHNYKTQKIDKIQDP